MRGWRWSCKAWMAGRHRACVCAEGGFFQGGRRSIGRRMKAFVARVWFNAFAHDLKRTQQDQAHDKKKEKGAELSVA